VAEPAENGRLTRRHIRVSGDCREKGLKRLGAKRTGSKGSTETGETSYWLDEGEKGGTPLGGAEGSSRGEVGKRGRTHRLVQRHFKAP